VFGEGLASARAVLLGEQPGDQEDESGHPFVGPAGKLLDHELGRIKATVHPSSILRAPDEEARERKTGLFVADLRVAAELLGQAG
jgi:uracil-DNA glycosylase